MCAGVTWVNFTWGVARAETSSGFVKLETFFADTVNHIGQV